MVCQYETTYTTAAQWLAVDSGTLRCYSVQSIIPPGTNTATTASTMTKSQAFSKGAKQEASAFPVIKDDKMYGSWHVSCKVVAYDQQVQQV